MPLPDWPRAHGAPLFVAQIRQQVVDFQVTEELTIEFSGDGEHDYLWIEKTGTNTEWLARQLAGFAGVPAKDIGYAGLKDRHAVTRQWFSVPRWHAPDWDALVLEGVSVLDVRRHQRKLRRGAHRANHFRIVLRGEGLDANTKDVEQRIQRIREFGVPNYFGEQRFGRGGGNVGLADSWAAGKRLPRHKRSIAISAARSFLFNAALAERVRGNTWDTMVPGDVANLDGSGSVFAVDTVDDEITRRCATMDIHPAGVLWGDGSSRTAVPAGHEHWLAALEKARVEPGTRSLRLKVSDLEMAAAHDEVTLSFSLPSGAFATAVLREIAATSASYD